jgi:hypothetical protein
LSGVVAPDDVRLPITLLVGKAGCANIKTPEGA